MSEAERDRLERLQALRNAIVAVGVRGIAFQDEPWWPAYCELSRALGIQTKTPEKKYVVASGNIIAGFELRGPFDDVRRAHDWGMREHLAGRMKDHKVIEVVAPREGENTP